MERKTLSGVSLFSGGGIGDLAMRAVGVRLLVASELLEDRAAVLARNFPEAAVISGDISQTFGSVVSATRNQIGNGQLDLLFATPPCQGMSKNGRGKLLNGTRAGTRPRLDPRNQLILHALNFTRIFLPRLVVFENVPEMQNTVIESPKGGLRSVMEVISEELNVLGYRGRWEVVEFADYGVPQRRQRLITVFTTSKLLQRTMWTYGTVMPPRTHGATPRDGKHPWVTVMNALKGVLPLDAKDEKSASSCIPFHRVPLLDRDKYYWVSNTPPGKGAFDNQCVNPNCLHTGNPAHGAAHDHEGINRANTHTPVYCERCGELLPRPWVIEEGEHRLMRGFTSAYKRMRGDLPASALTRNLSYACSDQKLHPEQNRVLSLHEAFILHTISDYEFIWSRADGKKLSDKTIREIIGESIPPRGLQVIFDYLVKHLQAEQSDDEVIDENSTAAWEAIAGLDQRQMHLPLI